MVKNLPAVQKTWVRKMPWGRKWQPTPMLLPGEPHGQRSLVGYSPQSDKESSDMTEMAEHAQTCVIHNRIYINSCEKKRNEKQRRKGKI